MFSEYFAPWGIFDKDAKVTQRDPSLALVPPSYRRGGWCRQRQSCIRLLAIGEMTVEQGAARRWVRIVLHVDIICKRGTFT